MSSHGAHGGTASVLLYGGTVSVLRVQGSLRELVVAHSAADAINAHLALLHIHPEEFGHPPGTLLPPLQLVQAFSNRYTVTCEQVRRILDALPLPPDPNAIAAVNGSEPESDTHTGRLPSSNSPAAKSGNARPASGASATSITGVRPASGTSGSTRPVSGTSDEHASSSAKAASAVVKATGAKASAVIVDERAEQVARHRRRAAMRERVDMVQLLFAHVVDLKHFSSVMRVRQFPFATFQGTELACTVVASRAMCSLVNLAMVQAVGLSARKTRHAILNDVAGAGAS